MCAVLGFYLKQPNAEDLEAVKQTFLQSKIRGLHATGVSYVKQFEVITDKRPIPADQFIKEFDFSSALNEDGNLYLIGHCRYSTSDLRFNQPIANRRLSIVHNGVITQELPENWKKLYDFNCETSNDSELLLRTIEANKAVLHVWEDSSLSVIELHHNKKMVFYRNHKRPIYAAHWNDGFVITSTADIALRSGYRDAILQPLGSVGVIKDFRYETVDFKTNKKDLQINYAVQS
jgi:glutamine phosphoribosylpyrophosphate amidotransferase